jgi:superfamily I DNA/RNA helicase
MELSIYQKNIIDAVLHGQGNIMIQAFAGAGKTSTLIEIMRQLNPKMSKLYCAFNTDIVQDITSKTEHIRNLKISTIHSLGLQVIRSNNKGKEIVIDEDKYVNHINEKVGEYSEIFSTFNYNQRMKFIANTKRLLNYSRNHLCDGNQTMLGIATKYGLNLLGDEINVAIKAMEWGKENIDTIDFGDMVWLPNTLPFRFPFYNFILVDECQDLSIAQQHLVLKCRNISTRYIFCGDEKQAIYSFSGADSSSFQNLLKIPNTKIYFLPICYRCADLIVEQAKQIVPQIECNGKHEKGEVIFNASIFDIKDGDMVICRNNSPLAKLYMECMKKNIPCYIKGKEIEKTLIEMVEDTNQDELNIDLKDNGVFMQLYNDLINFKKQIEIYEKCTDKMAIQTPQFKSKYDLLKTLEILSENLSTKDELIERIKKIFEDEKKDGVSLSTIHKAKGLENDTVHILCWSIFETNLKRMSQDWEITQEKNLQYVAITRAKHKLSYIEDANYARYNSTITLQELASIEYIINKVLGIQNRHVAITVEYANAVVSDFKPLDFKTNTNVVHGINSKPMNQNQMSSLKTLLQNKYKKK